MTAQLESMVPPRVPTRVRSEGTARRPPIEPAFLEQFDSSELQAERPRQPLSAELLDRLARLVEPQNGWRRLPTELVVAAPLALFGAAIGRIEPLRRWARYD